MYSSNHGKFFFGKILDQCVRKAKEETVRCMQSNQRAIKKWNYKYKLLQQQMYDFSYIRLPTHVALMLFFEGCFYLSTIDFTYSHATNSHILQHQRLLLQACGAHPSTLIVTWLFQIVRWRENQTNNWKVIMDVYLIFWIKFQNCFISTCFI